MTLKARHPGLDFFYLVENTDFRQRDLSGREYL